MMFTDKKYMLLSIDTEIEDRTDEDEIKSLKELRYKVETEQSLKFNEYDWLTYLVQNHREAELRDELEGNTPSPGRRIN